MLFLVLKYSGVCLFLFPFDLIGILKELRAAVASVFVGAGDNLGDYSSSMS